MEDFMANYWQPLLSALISGFILSIVKRFYNTYKKNVEALTKTVNEKDVETLKLVLKEEMNRKYTESVETDEELKQQINNIHDMLSQLKDGVLSVQKKSFLSECYNLLDADKFITNEDLAEVMKDHETYNALGGNHRGDELYAMVKEKFNLQQVKGKKE